MGNCADKSQEKHEGEIDQIVPPHPDFKKQSIQTATQDYAPSQVSLRLHSENTYFGDVKEHKANGKGKYVTQEYEYEGEWINGRPNGNGKIVYKNGTIYEGHFINGQPDGKGEFKASDGFWYKGDFHNGKFYGKGEAIWPNGSKYKGEFKMGVFHGDGEYTWSDGRVFKGTYKGGVKDGVGIVLLPDGKQFEGKWVSGDLIGELVLKNKTQN